MAQAKHRLQTSGHTDRRISTSEGISDTWDGLDELRQRAAFSITCPRTARAEPVKGQEGEGA
jgi:hypothetical protein